MTFDIIIVFAIIAIVLGLFIVERYSVDQVALAIPVVLLLTGILTPEEAISGFSNTATVTVAAMLAMSLGLVKTGAVAAIGRWAQTAPLGGPRTRLAILCVMVAVISPFLNNTAVVVVFLPVFIGVARSSGQPASLYLIPLSYAAILGGTVTLIGTSTNLIVYGMVQDRGLHDLTMFSIAPLGLIYLVIGLVYVLTVGRVLLPKRRGETDLTGKYEVRNFVTELTVTDESTAVGHTLADLRWRELYGVSVLGLHRDDRTLWAPGTRRRLRSRDVLYVQGHHDDLLGLAKAVHLATPVDRTDVGINLAVEDSRLAEILVGPASPVAGRTLAEIRFQQRYDVTVMAVQHLGQTVRARLADVRLEAGDLLLVHGPDKALSVLFEEHSFVPVSEITSQGGARPRAVVAIGILVGVVAMAGLGVMPILPAALTGVLLMVFTRCVRIEEMYKDLDWMIVVLLAGVIPLGIAMDKTGAAAWLGHQLAQVIGPLGPTATIAAFYLLTSLLTSIMSNNATAVVLTPIALLTAADLGMNPYALVVAVMFGASAGFMTPVAYQTNTLVYGPGGYRFSDYVKVGAPLNLILLVTAAVFIPRFWPS